MVTITKADAEGLYHVGAEFRNLDWAVSCRLGVWPTGMRFRIDGAGPDTHEARIIGALCIRDDGARLRVLESGRYDWRRG